MTVLWQSSCPMWQSDFAHSAGKQYHEIRRPAKKVLFCRLQETVVVRASETRTLESCAAENLPGLRGGIHLSQRSIPAPYLLQPILC